MLPGQAVASFRRLVRAFGPALLLTLAAPLPAQKAAPLERPPATPPIARIPVEPLGFRAPSRWIVDYRVPWATLDFVDNTHLLFTFHANELLRRDQPRGDTKQAGEDHQDQTIRALVLAVPSGEVTERASWHMHDRERYLWSLGRGRFLQREANTFYLLNGSLARRTTYYESPGPLAALEISPDQRQMVVEWHDTSAPAEPSRGIDNNEPAFPPRHPVRLLVVDLDESRGSKEAQLNAPTSLALIAGGYLRLSPGKENNWEVSAEPFGGVPSKITTLHSGCEPQLEAIGPRVFLASLCIPYTSDHLMQAWELGGHKLWEQQWGSRFVWGEFSLSPEGGRFAYESLALDHPVTTLDPIDLSTAQAQVVGVYDVRDGHLRLVTEADPMLTAGHNYALSDDGTRFAVLRGGAIEVYELPRAPQP